MDEGAIGYEYNLMMIERYMTLSDNKLTAGKHQLKISTQIEKPGSPGRVVIEVDGTTFAELALKRTVPLAFTASETFDVGADLGSPVSKHYYDRRPLDFDGHIEPVKITLD
jgi:arylsulfatase